jgi:hypothetical protein
VFFISIPNLSTEFLSAVNTFTSMLIGHHGKLGSGKSRGAVELRALLPDLQIEEKAFADNLKLFNAALCGTDIATQYAEAGKNQMIKIFNPDGDVDESRVTSLAGVMRKHRRFASVPNLEETLAKVLLEISNTFQPRSCTDITIGVLLQEIGTRFRRVFGEDVWVTLLMDEWTPKKNWIITDLRFANEKEAILSRGGKCIKFVGDPKGVRARSSRNLNHISETALDHDNSWDWVIDNKEDNIETMRTQLRAFLAHVRPSNTKAEPRPS